MDKVKVLIVEDDLSFAINLQVKVEELGYEVSGVASNADKAIEIIKADTPSLILLDILLEGAVSGIELAENLKHLGIRVIFITSHHNESLYDKAIATQPMGYLVKPFHILTLRNIIEKALDTPLSGHSSSEQSLPSDESIQFLKDYVFIKKNFLLEKVKIEDIDYVQSDRNYTELFVKGKKYVMKLSLRKMEELLNQKYFLRVNQRHLINMTKVESIDLISNCLNMGDLRFSIGRTYKESVINSLNKIT